MAGLNAAGCQQAEQEQGGAAAKQNRVSHGYNLAPQLSAVSRIFAAMLRHGLPEEPLMLRLLCLALLLLCAVPAAAREGLLADSLPDVTLRDEADSSTSLQALTQGHYTLLNFWATWCGPCRREMPGLQRLRAALAEQGSTLAIIPVSIEAGKLDRVQDYYRRNGLSGLPLYLLENRDDAIRLKLLGFPTTVLLDPRGTIVWRVAGELDWDDAQLRAKLQDDLAGKPSAPLIQLPARR